MSSETRRIVLIAADADEQRFYRDFFTPYETITLEVYPSFKEFRIHCTDRLYSGFVVDTDTLAQATTGDKEFFGTLADVFPVLRVRRGPEPGSFSGSMPDRDFDDLQGQALLDAFIFENCLQATPNGIRSSNRKNLFISALLYPSPPSPETVPLKVTIGCISEGGCMIVTAVEFREGQVVRLVVPLLEDPTPLRCEVRWIRPWSPDSLQLPGIGVAFAEISEAQHHQLEDIIKGEP